MNMKYVITYLFLLMASVLEVRAEVDPKFQIYLCFGQSNMAGDAPAEAVDMDVDSRFLTLEATNGTPTRAKGQWYVATPPIVTQGDIAKVGMADYFGRTMVAALPADYRVGVVDVAVNGADIRAFMSDQVETYNPWHNDYFARYDNDPYKRLVDMARIAQKSGVIKGILLHQGESNCGDQQWPQYVKIIYDRLIADLSLNAAEVPLLVGEVSEGSEYASHNEVIAQVPSVIPTAHVISSHGCPGGLHFSIEGYRIMAKRYALKMLELLGYPAHKDASYQFPDGLRKFYKVSSLDSYGNINLEPGQTFGISVVTAHFEDGHIEDVPAEAFLTQIGNGVTVYKNWLTGVTNEKSLVAVNYTDFTGETVSTSFYVNPLGSPIGMVTDMANSIMGHPSMTFAKQSADRNGDGVVNAADLVLMINGK
jgi:hypothetical protein